MTDHPGKPRDDDASPGAPAPDGPDRDADTPAVPSQAAARLTAFLKVARENAGIPDDRSSDTPDDVRGRAPREPDAPSRGTHPEPAAGTHQSADAGDDGSGHESVARAWEQMRAIEESAPAPVSADAEVDVLEPSPTPEPADAPVAPPPPSSPLRGRTSSERPEVPTLGAMLLEKRLVTQEQLRQAMERQKRTRRRLGRVLVEMGFATQEAVLEALSAQLGVPSTRVNSYTVNPDAVQCLSEKVARKHMAFPLLKVGSTLVVAIASPKDLHALDDLRFASGCSIQMMVAMETEIQAALDKYYGNAFGPSEAEEIGTVVIDIPGPQLDLHDEVAERSAVSLVDRIIAKAAADRASDIHLEPTKNSLRVRFRIDGTFHEVAQLLLALAPAVLARVKVLSAMDITEHRLPQDGRFSATVGGRGLDALRLSRRDRRERPEHHHHRGPGRVLAARSQSGPDEPQVRVHVRAGTASHPPAGPGRHHGR